LLLNFRQAAAVNDVAGIQLCNRLLFTEDSGFWSRFIWYRPIEITTTKRSSIQSKFNIILPVQKASKRGLTFLALSDKLFVIDVTVYLDVQKNPGPEMEASTTRLNMTHMHLNIPVNNRGVINSLS
jgi:hypothetical protein